MQIIKKFKQLFARGRSPAGHDGELTSRPLESAPSLPVIEPFAKAVAKEKPAKQSLLNSNASAWLETQFGLSRELLVELQNLGFVLAGGAAAAMMDVHLGHPKPRFAIGDADFFFQPAYIDWNQESVDESFGPIPCRSYRIVRLFERYGFSRRAITGYSIGFQRPPKVLAVPITPARTNLWSIGPSASADPNALTTTQEFEPVQVIIHPFEDATWFDSTGHPTPVWLRFDFTLIRAEITTDGASLCCRFDARLIKDREAQLLTFATPILDPYAELDRVLKYGQKGCELSYFEARKLLASYAELSQPERDTLDERAESLCDYDGLLCRVMPAAKKIGQFYCDGITFEMVLDQKPESADRVTDRAPPWTSVPQQAVA